MPTAIEFNNISKLYRLGLVSSGTLSNDLKRWWTMNVLHGEDPFLKVGSVNDRSKAADSDYVWALKDIDFKVEKGDVVGIIGKNGAGKSTLLKLLSKVTGPTTGTIKAKGRIASLLEVGTGFHPELTGRENIYMNGTILGMTKKEIDGKLDEIVDFSGCERYIDTPVKRYSSGMTVRLGFAVAAHLDPEILVVDEVLAVGDAEFQKKAIGKMQDVSRGEGRTVLFVSHNMASISNLCKTGVLLENGLVKYTGSVGQTINEYLSFKAHAWDNLADRFEGKSCPKMYVKNVCFNSKEKNNVSSIMSGDYLCIEVTACSRVKESYSINIGVYNALGEKLLHLSNDYLNVSLRFVNNESRITFSFDRFPLPEGVYTFNVSLWSEGERCDLVSDSIQLQISNGDYYHTGKTPPSAENKVLIDYSVSAK